MPCRLRRTTAAGDGRFVVTTVHDETGFANLVVWSSLFDRQRRIVLSARMLRCRGHVQREGDVIYVVAVQLETRRINAAMSDKFTPLVTARIG